MSSHCDYGEAVAFHRETTRISVRGTAKCSDCGRPVPKGASYIVTTSTTARGAGRTRAWTARR